MSSSAQREGTSLGSFPEKGELFDQIDWWFAAVSQDSSFLQQQREAVKSSLRYGRLKQEREAYDQAQQNGDQEYSPNYAVLSDSELDDCWKEAEKARQTFAAHPLYKAGLRIVARINRTLSAARKLPASPQSRKSIDYLNSVLESLRMYLLIESGAPVAN